MDYKREGNYVSGTVEGHLEGHQSGSELQCHILTCIHPLIFSLSSLTAAYWQKSPARMVTGISPGYLTTAAAPLGVKVSTESVSKINRSTSTTQSWPLSFHLLRYWRGAVVNISVSVLTPLVLTVGWLFPQGAINSTQQSISLRWGSDFRLEQRRLLSSFNCDSDLLKFNQLKVEYIK